MSVNPNKRVSSAWTDLEFRKVTPQTSDWTISSFQTVGSQVDFIVNIGKNERLASFHSDVVISATGVVAVGNAGSIRTRVSTESDDELFDVNGLTATVMAGLFSEDDGWLKRHYKRSLADTDGTNLSSADGVFRYNIFQSDWFPRSKLDGQLRIRNSIVGDPTPTLTALNALSTSKAVMEVERIHGVQQARQSFFYPRPREYFFDGALTAGAESDYTITINGNLLGYFLYAYQSGDKYTNTLRDMDASHSGSIEVTDSSGRRLHKSDLSELRFKSPASSSIQEGLPIFHHCFIHPAKWTLDADNLNAHHNWVETLKITLSPSTSVSGGVCIVPITTYKYTPVGDRDGNVVQC